VITNSTYNNLNFTGLVYIATCAPDEGRSLSNLIDLTKLPKDLLIFDNGGFPQDVDPIEEREILASLPLHIWMQVNITPLNPHPNDPEYRARQAMDNPQS
jgi:hypothetical protein